MWPKEINKTITRGCRCWGEPCINRYELYDSPQGSWLARSRGDADDDLS